MASVTLDEVWVHLGSDLSDYITLQADALEEQPDVVGAVHRRAGGNFQAVTRVGTAKSVTLGVPLANRAAVDQLRDWLGKELMVRDPRGRKVWGVCFAPSFSEVPAVDRAAIRFTVSEVTHSEVV